MTGRTAKAEALLTPAEVVQLFHVDPKTVTRWANAGKLTPSAEAAARLTSLRPLMADPVRLRLIYALEAAEELCLDDLALSLNVSEDSVSYALRRLRTAGLLVTRKQGRVVYNRLADDFAAPLRNHCLRQLIALTHTTDDTDAGADTDRATAPPSTAR